MPLRAKTAYHPYLIVAFYLQCLPDELMGRIPRSTRFDWRHKDTSSLFGYDWYMQNRALFDTLRQVSVNRYLLRVNKALIRVITLKRFIHHHAQRVKGDVSDISTIVLNNIRKTRSVLGLAMVLKCLQQPYSWYLRIRRRQGCSVSILSLCRIKHPAQLLRREITRIKDYCSDARFAHWPLASVYHQMRRESAAAFNISTFYKYVSLLGLKRAYAAKRRKNHDTGIRAERALQLLHSDVTVFRTADNQRNYLYLVQDNFSRAILSYIVSRECKAAITLENLEKVHAQYLVPASIKYCQLLTDDGSENIGPMKRWASNVQSPAINHVIAQKDVVFSNSMIEAANKQLKYRFLYHKSIADFDSFVDCVSKAIEDYNNRPHDVLRGLTPLEVLQGRIFDKLADQQQILQAKAVRIAEKKKTKCCLESF